MILGKKPPIWSLLCLLFAFLPGCMDGGKINYNNSLKISEGMTSQEVLSIMGKPDKIDNDTAYFNKIRRNLGKDYDSMYFYTPPFTASDGIEIYFRNDSVVYKRIEY